MLKRMAAQTFPFYLSMFLAPALAALPPSEALSTVTEVVDVAAGNTSQVHFTGFTARATATGGGGGVEAGLTNISQADQLSVFYVAKQPPKLSSKEAGVGAGQDDDGEVEVSFSATGMWRWKVEKVVGRFVNAYEDICGVVGGDE